MAAPAQKVRISGQVTGGDGSGALIGAQVYALDRKSGTATDADGRFSFAAESGSAVVVSYMGYASIHLTAPQHDTTVALILQLDSKMADEVEVRAKSMSKQVFTAQPGTYYLSAKQISLLPRFMGEADPIRAVTMAPGVAQTEGTQGFSVRGSGREQNLILLNGAPVYNPSHLLGLFSIFNADDVREVTLLKSGIPAQYGGRLSSVMLVESGSSKPDSAKVSGSIGILASSLRIDLPVVKDRLWATASVRRTYLNMIMDPMSDLLVSGNAKTHTGYQFTDINTSVGYKMSQRNYLDACYYYGDDVFSFKNKHNKMSNAVKWGNRVGSLRWRFVGSDRFSWTNSLTYSAYRFSFDADQSVYSMSTLSAVETIGLLSTAFYQHKPSNIIYRFGIDAKKHRMQPSDMKAQLGASTLKLPLSQELSAIEPAAFVHADWTASEAWLISAGVRCEYFAHLGPYIQQNAPADMGGDTAVFSANEVVQSYTNAQPRLSARYLISERSSVKASYSYTVQNIHLSSMSSSALPADIWYPATKGVRPMGAHQLTAGYFIQLDENKYLASAELFGKRGMNIGELKDDFFQLYNTAMLSSSAYYGDLYSYGSELSIAREQGRLTGSVSVTVSRSQMRVADLNSGNAYRSQYDKPVDGTAFASYKLNDKWSVAGMFVYSSGKTATMPVQRYVIQGNLVNKYSGRNEFRMPDYHRLDISATRTLASKGRLRSELILSIYNVYSRLNPYYVYYETTGDVEKMQLSVKAKAVSFFPILPSIAWRFSF